MPSSAVAVVAVLSSCALISAAQEQPAPAPPRPTVISLNAADWDVRYSEGVTIRPLDGMAGFSLDIPRSPGSLNYLTTPHTTPIQQQQSVIFTAQIVAERRAPTFQPVTPCGASSATVRAYIEQFFRKNADATYGPPTYRWWSNPIRGVLAPGLATFVVPIIPDHWSDADGHVGTDALAGFADALAHPAAIGMTFGSDCFFGHGVQVLGGRARFILTSYTIQ